VRARGDTRDASIINIIFMYYVLLFIALILFMTAFARFDGLASAKKMARIKSDLDADKRS
jgi:hypothetical protein